MLNWLANCREVAFIRVIMPKFTRQRLIAAISAALFSLLGACQSEEALAAGQEIKDCAECPPLVVIPVLPGASSQLAIARHELTWKEYIASVRQASCPLPKPIRETQARIDLDAISDSYPITHLAITEVNCYLGWISKKTGFEYRLPSGTEWEFAARAGAKTRFPWGNEPGFNKMAMNRDDLVARYGKTGWFDHKSLRIENPNPLDPRIAIGKDTNVFPVESFSPNAWGLYDVIGNVSESVSDTKPGLSQCIARFGKAKCRTRATRGGGWDSIRFSLDGKVKGLDSNFFEFESWRFEQFPEPHGLRIAREID